MNENFTRGMIRREWGVIALVLAVFLCGLPGIFAYPAERILFNPQAYKQALAEQGAYQQFPALVGEMIAEGGDIFLFGSGNRLLEVLQNSNYQVIIREIFPQDWVRVQADGLVDQFWAYFNLETNEFRLVVDFQPVKARLDGAQSGQIAGAIVAGFPSCKGQDILNWAQQVLQGNLDRLPLCKPPDPLLPAANLLVEGILRAGAAAMPEALDLAGVLHTQLAVVVQPVSTAWSRGFAVYRLYRQINLRLPVTALVLLAAAGLLARGTPRGALYWLGVGLVLPGFTGLVIALLAGLWSAQVVPLIVTRLFGGNLVLFRVLAGMLSSVSARFMVVSAVIALGVTVVGVALVVTDVWIRKREE